MAMPFCGINIAINYNIVQFPFRGMFEAFHDYIIFWFDSYKGSKTIPVREE